MVDERGGGRLDEPTVAVHGGRFGELMVLGLQAVAPDAHLVAAGSAEAGGATVLATLVDHTAAIEAALTPSVRWVHVLGAGVDGFPLGLVGDRILTCSRGAAAPAIAEFVLAAMLAFEKQLPQSWVTQPPEEWNVAALGSLSGKTVGIIGLGSIGIEVARRALAFGTTVLAVRRRPRPAPEGVVLCGGLEELLPRADHLVLAAPATDATDRLLDKAAFEAMKTGVHLVNVARGTLVDQQALLSALDDGRVAMASLDVADPEPLPAGHPLYRHPKVRLSPHVSWSSPQTAQRTLELFAENLERYRDGAPLRGAVDVAAGY